MAFRIIRDDITRVRADAIVNTANPRPTYVRGTDGAIYAAAGAEKLLEERRKIGRMEVGQAAATPAFALPAKYIIHTVGPSWWSLRKDKAGDLRRCYENCLTLAEELGCESIAFPFIATGTYGFPKDEALQIAVSVFREFLMESDMQITLVVFDRDSFNLFGKIFSGIDAFIDEKYVSDRTEEEYSAASQYYGSPEPEREENLFSESRYYSERESFYDEELPSMPYAEAPSPSFSAAFKESSPAHEKASLKDRLRHVADTWQESLLYQIDEKGYTDTEVYKRANVDRKLFSKIRSNAAYQPKKITAVAFALALRLNLDETRDFLSRAGYAFSPSSVFDLIIEYFIEQEVYDTYTINLALFEHGQPTLGE